LDKHLKNLNGRITKVVSKINEDGKKIKIIKIKKKEKNCKNE